MSNGRRSARFSTSFKSAIFLAQILNDLKSSAPAFVKDFRRLNLLTYLLWKNRLWRVLCTFLPFRMCCYVYVLRKNAGKLRTQNILLSILFL